MIARRRLGGYGDAAPRGSSTSPGPVGGTPFGGGPGGGGAIGGGGGGGRRRLTMETDQIPDAAAMPPMGGPAMSGNPMAAPNPGNAASFLAPGRMGGMAPSGSPSGPMQMPPGLQTAAGQVPPNIAALLQQLMGRMQP